MGRPLAAHAAVIIGSTQPSSARRSPFSVLNCWAAGPLVARYRHSGHSALFTE